MTQSTYDLMDTVLITGGAGGIGRALAENLIKAGKTVLIAGRTESSLKSTADEIGAAGYYVLDTGKTDQIPSFVKSVIKEHPKLNCIINNAGVQRPLEFPGSNFSNGDYGFDLAKADQEIDINIRGPMYLAVSLLPHFTSLDGPSVIVNVSSSLGFCPTSIINPCYNGTKAWLHAFTVNMRTQLAKNATKVKVVEVAPPMVETDLHRERTNPDDNKKSYNSIALELPKFIDEVERGLKQGQDIITAGTGKKVVQLWEDSLGEHYRKSLQK